MLCFDSFLYNFTILPIRCALAGYRGVLNLFSSATLPPSQKADLLRVLLLVASILVLIPLTDASKIYHTIRGQDTIKLYVIFNALEVSCSQFRFSFLLLNTRRSRIGYVLRLVRIFWIAYFHDPISCCYHARRP